MATAPTAPAAADPPAVREPDQLALFALHPEPPPSPPGPAANPGRRQLRLVLLGLVLGVSLAALDMTIVATAIRTIADDLGGLSQQAWATTAYLITSAITTPLYGALSDRWGRKPLLLVAITVFVAGSLLCATAGSMPQLAAYRAVQGLGAGGLFSLSVTVVGDLVAPRERARYTGYLIAVYAVFGVLGPVAGGFFAETESLVGVTGWRWVFLVNVPVGLLALAVVGLALRLPPRSGTRRVDMAGAAALAVGLVPLLAVADEGRTWGWASPSSLACYGAGAVGLALFVLAERRVGADALLPLHLFREPAFRLGTLASVVVGFGMFGALTALPLYLQIVQGADPGEAGLLMLPLVLGIMATIAVSGKVIAATGRYRVWPVLGAAVMIAGFLWLSAMAVDTPFWVTAICMTVFGVGLGANLQSLTLAMQNALPQSEVGVATAAATFTRQLGGSLGAAVFLSILFGTLGDRITAALRRAAGDDAFRDALRDPQVLAEPANRSLAEGLRSGAAVGEGLLEDSSFLDRLAPVLARPFLEGFAGATAIAFVAGALALVAALAAAVAMPDHALRDGLEGGVE